MNVRALALALAACAWLAAGDAAARSRRGFETDFETFWAVAVRYLRVDRNYAILDKDKEVGYVVFEYKDKDQGKERVTRGTLEVIERAEKRVTAQLGLDGLPSYNEGLLMNGIVEKLREEGR